MFTEGKPFRIFLVYLFSVFCLLYEGTKFITGAVSPTGWVYLPWLHVLDYIPALTNLLARSTVIFLELFSYSPVQLSLRLVQLGNHAVNINNSCLGYGVMSFWIAFVVANRVGFWRTMAWSLLGCAVICILNILRIALLLLASGKQQLAALPLDHHTIFNIVTYSFVFGMMWYFDVQKRQIIC